MFRKLPNKFHRNRLSFVEDITKKHVGLLFSGHSVLLLICIVLVIWSDEEERHLVEPDLYSVLSFVLAGYVSNGRRMLYAERQQIILLCPVGLLRGQYYAEVLIALRTVFRVAKCRCVTVVVVYLFQ